MKRVLGTFLLYVGKFEVVLIVLMAAVIIGVIAAQVFMRYFFNRPFTWAEELATLVLIYLTFFSADVVYKQKRHIAVDYFAGKLPPAIQRVVAILLYIAIAGFLLTFIPQTLTLVRMQARIITTAAITVPKSFFTLPVLLVFPSMLLSTLYFLICEIDLLLRYGNKPCPEGTADAAGDI